VKKDWYAVSAAVSKDDKLESKFVSISKPMAIQAFSEEEACGIAIKYLYNEFPVDDGWQNHSAQAVKVPAS